MPAFVAVLSRVFIGFPGLLLWLAGGASTGLLAFSVIPDVSNPDFQGLTRLCIAIAATILGYLMVAADGILSGKARYEIPGENIPQLIAMELGVQITTILGVCAAIGTIGHLGSGKGPLILGFFIVTLLSLFGAARLFERLESMVETWQADELDIDETAPPPTEDQ